MKKISALILAFVLVAAFASVAFAANTPNSWSQFPQRRKDNTVRSYTALAQCIARAFTGNAIDIDGNFGPQQRLPFLLIRKETVCQEMASSGRILGQVCKHESLVIIMGTTLDYTELTMARR